MKIVSLTLLVAGLSFLPLQPAAADQFITDQRAETVRVILKGYRQISASGRELRLDHAARLAGAAEAAGKTPEFALETWRRFNQFRDFLTTMSGADAIAAASIASGKPDREFLDAYRLANTPRMANLIDVQAAAEVAAAAVLSDRPVEQVKADFHYFTKEIGGDLLAASLLASAAAKSRGSRGEVLALFRILLPMKRDFKHAAAFATMAMFDTRRPIEDLIEFKEAFADFEFNYTLTAEMLVYGALARPRLDPTAGWAERIRLPVVSPAPGGFSTAEDAFRFNWNGAAR